VIIAGAEGQRSRSGRDHGVGHQRGVTGQVGEQRGGRHKGGGGRMESERETLAKGRRQGVRILGVFGLTTKKHG